MILRFYADVLASSDVRCIFEVQDPDEGPPSQPNCEGTAQYLGTDFVWNAPSDTSRPTWPAGATGIVWVETMALADQAAELQRKIDRDHNQIITDRIGAKQREYDDAYADACAFRDALWSGTPPQSVSDYATIRGWTPQAAAQDVIDTGTAWVAASLDLRNHRIARKQDAARATDPAQLPAIWQAWTDYRNSKRAQLGLAPIQEQA